MKISSSTMHVPWDSAGCFCPVGDLVNYAALEDEQVVCEAFTEDGMAVNGEQVDAKSARLTDGVFEVEFDAYCFYARRNYKKGNQVRLSYGTHTNLELLEHYDFTLNSNPNCNAYIPLPHDLHSLHSWPKDSLQIDHNGTPSFDLLVALRIWATPKNLHKSI